MWHLSITCHHYVIIYAMVGHRPLPNAWPRHQTRPSTQRWPRPCPTWSWISWPMSIARACPRNRRHPFRNSSISTLPPPSLGSVGKEWKQQKPESLKPRSYSVERLLLQPQPAACATFNSSLNTKISGAPLWMTISSWDDKDKIINVDLIPGWGKRRCQHIAAIMSCDVGARWDRSAMKTHMAMTCYHHAGN